MRNSKLEHRPAPAPWLLAAALTLNGCGPARLDPAPPLPDRSGPPDAVLYLIGDAGDPESGSPVLDFLAEDAAARATTTQVVIAFLGDNIYEKGLHEPGHPSRDHDVLALETQLDVLRDSGATGVFVSGNHDWGPGGEEGLEQIRRQAEYLKAAASAELDVAFLPRGGCPGPVSEPIGDTGLLVAVDTEWLLRYESEAPPGIDCPNGSAAAAYGSLREVLSGPDAASRHVVILAHHPLKTNGEHGGYFSVKNQLFPLTNLWGPLYIPLPFLYPIGRNSGVSSQDLSNPRNRRMRDSLVTAASAAPHPPLAFASGHEHNLQVFRPAGFGAEWLLVSGAGSRLTELEKADALFAAGRQHRERGYMRLEFFRDGAVLLTVITDGTASCRGNDGSSCEPGPKARYWSWMSRPGGLAGRERSGGP